MARNNVKFVPLSIDDKPKVLLKLQGRPYFEKFLTWTSTPFRSNPRSETSCRLMVPAWFVHKHGDKIRQLAILRTQNESSTKAWPVTLKISNLSPTSASVRFSGGWKAFATSHGLLEGDSLVFALTTVVSEFEVYVFRSCTNKRDAAANAKVNLAADPKEKRAVIAMKKLDSPQTDLVTKHTTCPTFFKRLAFTNVARGYLEIPSHFMKIYGSRIHSVVKLQGIHEHSPEQSMECRQFCCEQVRYCFGAQWRVFAAENHLQVGHELLFILTADSFFIVRAALPIPPSIALQKSMQDSCTSSGNSG